MEYIDSVFKECLKWYEGSPLIVQVLVGWILIKNIILRWVSDEVRSLIIKPLVKTGRRRIVRPVSRYVRARLGLGTSLKARRKAAIRQHYRLHHTDKLHACQTGDCVILAN